MYTDDNAVFVREVKKLNGVMLGSVAAMAVGIIPCVFDLEK